MSSLDSMKIEQLIESTNKILEQNRKMRYELFKLSKEMNNGIKELIKRSPSRWVGGPR